MPPWRRSQVEIIDIGSRPWRRKLGAYTGAKADDIGPGGTARVLATFVLTLLHLTTTTTTTAAASSRDLYRDVVPL